VADNIQKKTGLGRGLSALMADVNLVAGRSEPQPPQPSAQGGQMTVPIDQIHPNPDQPRRRFSEQDLVSLTESITERGIIQPLILRADPRKPNEFQIVAGERRWRAAQRARLHEVPVLIRELTDLEVLEIAIIENIQRSDLNPIEEGLGYRQLMDKFGHTQEQVSQALGKSRSHIANLLRLLGLPQEVQTLLEDGEISTGHARALITAENPNEIAQRIVKNGLSVRQVEKLAKGAGRTKRTASKVRNDEEKDADTRALENDLRAALGMKVEIAHHLDSGGGQIGISYDDLEQLDELCRLLSRQS
jgi:ParB family chromosome partitioning protein